MKREEVEQAVSAAERAVELGEAPDLGALGFWRAVGAVKRDAKLLESYADRIAVVDRIVFERWALLSLPIRVGTLLMVIGTMVGLLLIGWSYGVTAPWNGMLVVVGTEVLVVTTHGLAHLLTGSLSGIRFSHWFIGSIARPQPGVKTDYSTYLRTPASRRAWMHASGAIVTKLMPFLMLGAAFAAGVPGWAPALLIIQGVLQVVTDLVWSVRSSDWKRFRREMRLARR